MRKTLQPPFHLPFAYRTLLHKVRGTLFGPQTGPPNGGVLFWRGYFIWELLNLEGGLPSPFAQPPFVAIPHPLAGGTHVSHQSRGCTKLTILLMLRQTPLNRFGMSRYHISFVRFAHTLGLNASQWDRSTDPVTKATVGGEERPVPPPWPAFPGGPWPPTGQWWGRGGGGSIVFFRYPRRTHARTGFEN